ncbi:hypothetical protein BaRGS_00018410, partial [Batillaria attramentaria]
MCRSRNKQVHMCREQHFKGAHANSIPTHFQPSSLAMPIMAASATANKEFKQRGGYHISVAANCKKNHFHAPMSIHSSVQKQMQNVAIISTGELQPESHDRGHYNFLVASDVVALGRVVLLEMKHGFSEGIRAFSHYTCTEDFLDDHTDIQQMINKRLQGLQKI